MQNYIELKNRNKIPNFGLGTWHIGGTITPDYSEDDKYITIIKKAIDLGYRLIDTAEIYGNGHSEEIIGQAIKGYDRQKLFIISKVWPTNLKYYNLINACKGSLKRLNTDYIDLYLIHSPNSDIDIKETMAALNYLKEKGYIKSIGVSNFYVNDLKKAIKYSKEPIVVNQIEYSLFAKNRGKFIDSMESKIIPFCKQNNIKIISYSPLFNGKIESQNNKLLEELEKKYNKTKNQIALNWLIQKGTIPIPKASTLKHLKENLDSLYFKLEEKDIKKLDNEL
jgi:diketogulonate reductase-like aldo/keto reductase